MNTPAVIASAGSAWLEGESLAHLDADLTGLAAPQKTARELVRAVSAGAADDERVDDIVLVADELVGNAREHAADAGPMAITVERYAWGLAVQVTDSCPVTDLEPELPAAESEHGRGLFLVDALASTWGVRPGGHGKIVRAVFVGQEGRADAVPAPSEITDSTRVIH